ncbi:MAG: hypothetical protein BMS9Abin26_0666 [Gammaproteobacteria bacterium]|nr:MAG: hypothetical protein BMS9Abin26_0666 [Gammaproteobacteria bacterium]
MKKTEKQFLKLFSSLSESDQQALIRFAEFLNQTEPSRQQPLGKPEQPGLIHRPEDESVIKAIKRLSGSYPMLEKEILFHQTSSLMTQHIMQGRDPKEVIDELEEIFKKQYENYLRKFDIN